jgi:hypothetical protein
MLAQVGNDAGLVNRNHVFVRCSQCGNTGAVLVYGVDQNDINTADPAVVNPLTVLNRAFEGTSVQGALSWGITGPGDHIWEMTTEGNGVQSDLDPTL